MVRHLASGARCIMRRGRAAARWPIGSKTRADRLTTNANGNPRGLATDTSTSCVDVYAVHCRVQAVCITLCVASVGRRFDPSQHLSKPARATSLEQSLALFGAVTDRVSTLQAPHDNRCHRTPPLRGGAAEPGRSGPSLERRAVVLATLRSAERPDRVARRILDLRGATCAR